MTILIASIVDAAVVLGMALVAVAALRRRSAAVRHAILASAVVIAAIAPALEMLVPTLPVIQWYHPISAVSSGLTLTSPDATVVPAASDAAISALNGLPWVALLLAVWVFGAVLTCAPLAASLLRLTRLTARCTPVRDGRWREMTDQLSHDLGLQRHVEVLQSTDRSLLVTCGVLRPRIILPTGAGEWSDDRKRVVLAHELAHVRRHDGATQLVAEALRVIHWFNPLVSLSCRRLRQESEYACDDAVLSGGVEPTEYATHLLEVARHVSGHNRAWALAPAIAHPSTLERRIVAMLHQRNREPLTRRASAAVIAASLTIAIPITAAGIAAPEARPVTVPGAPGETAGASSPERLAGVTTAARGAAAGQNTQGTISGSVLDQTGGALPGVQVALIDREAGLQYDVVTDGSGRFALRDVPAARYELVARLPGFAAVSNVLTLTSGGTIQRLITLPLGTVQETITVVCGPTPRASGAAPILGMLARSFLPVLSAQEPATAPIRVGGSVRAPRKLTDAVPTCPATTVPAADTWVRLSGRVGVDGFVNDMKLIPGNPGAEPPMEFVDSALDAVRQWTFTPTLLNGRPVDVNILVQVLFKRG